MQRSNITRSNNDLPRKFTSNSVGESFKGLNLELQPVEFMTHGLGE